MVKRLFPLPCKQFVKQGEGGEKWFCTFLWADMLILYDITVFLYIIRLNGSDEAVIFAAESLSNVRRKSGLQN